LLKYFSNKTKEPIFASILKLAGFFLLIKTKNHIIKRTSRQHKDKKLFLNTRTSLDYLLNQFKN